MRRFEFSLEAALRWRQSQVELEELKLRKLFVEVADLEQQSREIERTQQAEREYVQQTEVSSAARTGLADYLRWAKTVRERLRKEEAECRMRIDRQRSALVAARRGCELLVRLKSRHQREWEAAYDKELENLASEAFLARWNSVRGPR